MKRSKFSEEQIVPATSGPASSSVAGHVTLPHRGVTLPHRGVTEHCFGCSWHPRVVR